MKVDEHLDGLKKISRVEAPPFLYTRIKAQIDAMDLRAPKQWVWAFAGSALVIILLNVSILVRSSRQQPARNIEAVISGMQLSTSNELYHE